MGWMDMLLGGLGGAATAGVNYETAKRNRQREDEDLRLQRERQARMDALAERQFGLSERSTNATIANLEADNARAGRAETLGRATTAYNALPADFDINTLPEDLRHTILSNLPTVTKPGATPRLGSMALSVSGVSVPPSMPAAGGPPSLPGAGTFSMPSVPTFGMAKPVTTRVATAREQETEAARVYQNTVLKPQLEAAAEKAEKDGLPEIANYYRQQAMGIEGNLGAGAYKPLAQREKEATFETNEAIRLTNAQEAARAQGQIAVAGAQGKNASTGPQATSLSTPYRNALDRVLGRSTDARRREIRSEFDRLAAAGDEESLRSRIRQLAVEGENVDTKNRVESRIETIDALRDARGVIDQLEKSGVQMNIAAGSLEELAQKLGTTRDPRLAQLGVQLNVALMNYRRGITGAAFSESESRAYQGIWPRFINTPPLNKALIDGLLRSMQTSERTYWDRKLGKEGASLVLGDAGDFDIDLSGGK